MLCINVDAFTVRIQTNLLRLSSGAAKCTRCTISALEAGSNACVHILLAVLLFFFYCKLLQKTPRVEMKLSAALCKMACTVPSSETDY